MHQVKKLIPAKCVRTHLSAFERTHGRTHEQGSNACLAGPNGYLRSNVSICGRTHAQSALAATAVICDRTHALRSTTNNWCVRTQVVRSNAGSAFEHTPVTCQPINSTLCFLLFFLRLEVPLEAKNLPVYHCKPSKLSFIYFMFYFTLNYSLSPFT
jgi:hypothetical protein